MEIATSCDTGIEYGHWFISQLLYFTYFTSNFSIMARAKQWKKFKLPVSLPPMEETCMYVLAPDAFWPSPANETLKGINPRLT